MEEIYKLYIFQFYGAPGLDNYASIGEEQLKRVEYLYLKILLAMGNNGFTEFYSILLL
jgi:hypothetical protein